MEWTASPWDIKSVEFLMGYDIPFLKIPSDKVKDHKYLDAVRKTELPVILSSGGANISDVEKALEFFQIDKLILMQCTSEYPTKTERLNLRAMLAMKERFKVNGIFITSYIACNVRNGSCLWCVCNRNTRNFR